MSEEMMQAETIEVSGAAEETSDAAFEAFDSEWDGDGLTATEDAEMDMEEPAETDAEADQQEAEEEEDASGVETPETDEAPEQNEAEKETAEDQRFVLKHLDEVKEVSRDEVIVLAQKGMDYDRKVGNLTEELTTYKDFLKEITPPGMTAEQMMDITRARIFKQTEAKAGREISETDALLKIQRDKAEAKAAAKDAEKAQAERSQQQAKEKNNEAIRKFIAEYPDVKAEDIPQEVWEAAKADGDLLGAYTRFELKQLRAENKALKQNEKNKARSTGSRKTAGAASAKDPFDAAWDSF